MLAALRRRMQSWMRPRQAETLPACLQRNRIYVLPTMTGLFFGLLLGTMGLGALNFNNNPALLLALLLAGAAQASLISAHMQLSGVVVDTIAADPVPAGEPLRLRIGLGAHDARMRRGMRLASGNSHVHVEFDHNGGTAELPLPTERRGLMPLPRLELSTVQPLGLARAWAYVWPAQSALVYPAPEAQAPPLPAPAGDAGRAQVTRAGDDVHHLRGYRTGDAPRSVAWKASARRDSLLVREYEQHRSDQLLLDWPLTAGLPHEQRIRRLARWVDDAEREGRRYALQIPGQAPIPMGLGEAHRHRCLRALALMPGEAAHG
ncbi:DUF58 domain-containing protein [Thermomonas sp. HDW16]|uniref:DUF58 domain-containing protein n=1 Tax=Thermomonas sp. HDW16 TaxID=2714945 RepID=UPI00140E91E9|nr:DUF58 domain-containing protein [Thermomonas sp. HDW16]QIL21002.1 DUF58 domain-containing protein [Thermomonas sp. HDW16]